ncbi:MAG: Formate--tetrahydrofolate ligase, partial [Firmicutes bacterium]|nr:Formate--tetrahydrofolate ligase [Bacillota bacterium]
RVMDLNERALRNIVLGLGGKADGIPRESGFDITVASEVMAELCLASDLMDLKERFKRMVVAYTYDGKPVTADDLHAAGSMALLMKDAIKPNLVQTVENTPAFVHGGPFANIAHGCNSVMATQMGLKMGDYLITEAGFGADLGAEKFLNLKCRFAGLKPDALVLVATIRALKNHGGVKKDKLAEVNMEALAKGVSNLEKQLENLNYFGPPVVVALNEFPGDTQEEIEFVKEKCQALGAEMAVSKVWAEGGAGGEELAHKVMAAAQTPSTFNFLYDLDLPLKTKIETICGKIYGAAAVNYSKEADNMITRFEELGYRNLPICMAKTQYSLSDDANAIGRPTGFTMTIREVRLAAGAGFIVALAGAIMTMPGLGKTPAAEKIDILPSGEIVGLF